MLLVRLLDNVTFGTSFTGGFIPLLEMPLVCLWENVLFAMFLKGYTLNWNAACVSVGESIMCTCFCVDSIHLIEMLIVCLWENISFAQVLPWVLYA